MTGYSRSPRLVKGAIIGVDLLNPLASVILFQYNPKTLRRQVQGNFSESQGGGTPEVARLAGAPKETISANLMIDAADQLEKGDDIAKTMGIAPQLAAMEMLLYPKSVNVIRNTILMAAGSIEVLSQDAPFTLFIWGAKRVLPVKISGFTISEEEYDPNLNPIRATVDVNMDVLSYNDFSITHPGYYMFMAHQVVKEVMAVVGSVGNISAVAGGEASIL